MDRSYTLFELSFEVANKVGGIHTVLTTKAKTAAERFGDRYFTVGPLLQGGAGAQLPFDDEPGHEDFVAACREANLPIRIGRWRIPGRPRCILVGFGGLYEQKNGILSGLWERHQVDSLAGGWDYVEPVLFATAAAMVIEKWWAEYLAPFHQRMIVQAHEWMTGAALLHLKERVPSAGLVFTTHATMLGRALASLGIQADGDLGGKTPAQLATEHGVAAKHSLEGVCARKADVFTTVSSITADEARLLHERQVDVLLPNGIDLEVMDELAAGDRTQTRRDLVRVARALIGSDVADAAFVGIAGRYEFHNKGIELLLDSLAVLNTRPGRPVVAFVMVPAGNSGVRGELLERLANGQGGAPIGLCTHNLFDDDKDPVQAHCRRLGLDNRAGSRVKIVQMPIYFRPDDGLLNREYEAVVAAMDLGAFPSFYEPWGYTPQEALATGVPTITTDLAGFGRWALAEKLGPDDGIQVIARERVPYAEVKEALVRAVEQHLQRPADPGLRDRCRRAAARTAWKDLFANYQQAYDLANAAIEKRSLSGVPQYRQPRRPLPTTSTSPAPRLSTFEVAATLPSELKGLERLARNFWWSWTPGVRDLFEELALGFDRCGENPVLFLQQVDLQELTARASDRSYLKRLHAVLERFQQYLDGAGVDPDIARGPSTSGHPIAYFSAEFAVHHSLPIYSGGLGVLAGDHLKSASDLGVPLVAVGLFYRFGYMQQRLQPDGQQLVVDRENLPRNLALEAVRGADGRPIEVSVPLPGREVVLRAWLAMVGRVRLYLLDANLPQNRPEDRDITRNLYGGDSETRIQQEIVLGRGGVRMLRALGLKPSCYHMNEGHAAFLTLERVSRLVRGEGLPFDAAREYVMQTTLFTTHTPVPAGHDRFGEDVMRRYFGDCEEWVGLPWERFFALGQASPADKDFNVTYLAMNFANFVNGVSRLHGVASKKLLHPFWHGLTRGEVPITSVTNGVHLATWTSNGIAELLRHNGSPVRPADFERARKIARSDLWRVRRHNKQVLIEAVRRNLQRSFTQRGDSPVLLSAMLAGLDEKALFLGFARRFAPYKRAHLLFSDQKRLQAILSNPERPVRILVSGKAHPRDGKGQDILRNIHRMARSPEFVGRVLFVEDYDMAVARALVQGVDVWVNTPTRMEEASGTSGMKAACNGVLNLSIADGWWPEAADGKNGWTIGGGQDYSDTELQNQADATALYRLLEEEVVPAWFSRDGKGQPDGWLDMVVHCLGTVPLFCNTDRMVGEYFKRAYRPLATSYFRQQEHKKQPARERARDFQRIKQGFAQLKVVAASTVELQGFRVGQHLEVRMEVDLGPLRAEDVVCELVVGRAVGQDELEDLSVVPLPHTGLVRDNVHAFEGGLRIEQAGHYSQGLRVRVRDDGGHDAKVRGLVVWA